MPVLASLAILVAALRNSIQALEAFHTDLAMTAWNPEADPLLGLAQAIRANARSLATVLNRYQETAVEKLYAYHRGPRADA
ncbi:hypothetical protein ACFL5O_11165 [Myxococcota bacterium]